MEAVEEKDMEKQGMEEQREILYRISQASPYKIIISKPGSKDTAYRKIVIEKKESYYQAAAYTERQVFHQNIPTDGLEQYLADTVTDVYLQVNAWDDRTEHMYLCSRKGKVTYKAKRSGETAEEKTKSHNRKKNYILEEGMVIPPLVDMGVFTAEGKVVRTMYDKFRQINRFLEIIEDAVCWNARMIFSVPCCQHELNGQIETEDYSLLTRYGIIKERFSALATDAIRANLLECCGYRTQILEFIDFAHTPKNLLIRAVRKGGSSAARTIVPKTVKNRYLGEVERMMEEFHLNPTLYGLLKEEGKLD